jgi:hypothetical protein
MKITIRNLMHTSLELDIPVFTSEKSVLWGLPYVVGVTD